MNSADIAECTGAVKGKGKGGATGNRAGVPATHDAGGGMRKVVLISPHNGVTEQNS